MIEVVVTIAIIIVLSVISGPIYNSYATKAKQAEGYALLGTILSAEKAYYQKYDMFYYTTISTTCNNELLGIDARPNKYYTAFGGGSAVAESGKVVAIRFWASSSKVKGLNMIYNLTTGVTFQ
ncbi:MAG: hypothetical protein II816_07880 [Elusimicrobia bacterium]|nr:hypothetical protein [Elusimicrobiota bacterium]